MAPRRHILFWLLVLLLSTSATWAQTSTPSPGPSASPGSQQSTVELQRRLAEVESSLKAAPTPAQSPVANTAAQPPSYYSSLLRLETSLRRLISLRENIALLQAQIERIDEETQAFTQRGLEQDRPYPVTLLDELQYQLALAQAELKAQETSLTSARADAKMQVAQREDREAQRRRILEQAGDDTSLDQERAAENAAWAVKAAETAVEVADAEVLQAEKAQVLAQRNQALLTRKVDLVKAHFLFTKAILDEQLNQLDAERAEITAQRAQAEALADETMEKVKALADANSPEKTAEREAQTEWLTTYQRQKILLEQALELNLAKRDLWERRYNLSQGLGLTALNDWEESTRGVVRRLESAREAMENQLSQLRGRIATVVEAAPDNSVVKDWKNVQVKALAAHQSALETALTESAQASVLAQRFLSEISETRKGLSWRERAYRGWAWLLDIWRVELYSIGDSSVTVGKMLGALLVLVIGLMLVGRTTHFVSNRLLAHLPLPDSSRVNIERGLRYFFVLLVFLFALRVVNIPLTIFTFLGGSLAIAVGFGAQNILNNFISGLILMAERPVRVGDLIEVDGTTGVVEEIGARSTRVRLAIGIHVVLPNSLLLENKVINWTLTDQMVRTNVSVGVAYGSDPQQVMELISRAAMSVDLIEKTPEHFVLLEDFGDSSLVFTVHYWVSIAPPVTQRMSESQLRLAIIELFEEAGITIPFPQRDLNLTQPVAVRIVEAAQETSKKREP